MTQQCGKNLLSNAPDWINKLMSQSQEVYDYFHEVMACPYARSLPNDTFLLPKQNEKNSFVLVQSTKEGILFCPDCDDCVTFNNLRKGICKDDMRQTFCIHLQAVSLMKSQNKHNTKKLDDKTSSVYFVQEKTIKIAVVYPKKTKFGKATKNVPGVVVRSPRMTKWRCKSCKGREGCLHLNIFLVAENESELIKGIESLRLKELETAKRKTRVDTDLVDQEININDKPEAEEKKTSLNP
jgi:hypothetical protein